jgi:uncharacterized protein YydD (DUF2326 family)
MIYSIYSTLPTFKTLVFKPGMNLLLADKSPGATDRQTRNRAGKTSLIELIHFLMGGNCDAHSIFKADELVTCTFGIEFDLGDGRTSGERVGEKPSKLVVRTESGDKTLKCLRTYDWDGTRISNANWKKVLGALMFDLKEDQDDDSSGASGPTFRSLFSYFVRRQNSGAFTSHIKIATQQQPGDYQVTISYLLGLDWTVPQSWQRVRDREKALKTLRTEAAKGTFGSMIGTTAELRTQLTVAEESTRKLRENVTTFQVLPEYRAFEAEASELTQRLGELADQNTIDLQLISELENSFRMETPPEPTDLNRSTQQGKCIKRRCCTPSPQL